MNSHFGFEKSIVFLLLALVLVSCSPNGTDTVRTMPEADAVLGEKVSSDGGILSEIVADPYASYAEYSLDQGAVSFSLPDKWDLYMDGGSVMAFQNGSAYFQAERAALDGEAESLHEVIEREKSLWFGDSRAVQSEITEIAGFEGVVSAFGKDYEGGTAGSLYIGAFCIRSRYYVLFYQSPTAFAEADYEAFREMLGRVRADEKLVPLPGEETAAVEKTLEGQGEQGEDLDQDGPASSGEGSEKQGSAGEKEKLPGSKDYSTFSLKDIPEYDGSPFIQVNEGIPFFTEEELVPQVFQDYTPLDDLGRCGRAMACLGPETMPDQPRGSIGMIRPSGWQIARYKDIDGTYLYNRCHLIGYQLSGQNANVLNLITGTRYMNMTGMEPFESRTAGYMETTGNHVLYRVTPFFEGNNLVARGVLMEARSVENGDLQFCVFCYNVQPGIDIDYSDGSSRGEGYLGSGS